MWKSQVFDVRKDGEVQYYQYLGLRCSMEGCLWKTCANVENSVDNSVDKRPPTTIENGYRVVTIRAIARQGGVAFWCAGTPYARPSGRMELRRGAGRQEIAAKLSAENTYRTLLQLAAMAGVNEAKQYWQRTWPIDKAVYLGVTIHRTTPVEHKPDLSNYVKLVEDALTGLLWTDDRLIQGYLPGTMKAQSERAGVSLVVLPVIAVHPLSKSQHRFSIEGREWEGARA